MLLRSQPDDLRPRPRSPSHGCATPGRQPNPAGRAPTGRGCRRLPSLSASVTSARRDTRSRASGPLPGFAPRNAARFGFGATVAVLLPRGPDGGRTGSLRQRDRAGRRRDPPSANPPHRDDSELGPGWRVDRPGRKCQLWPTLPRGRGRQATLSQTRALGLSLQGRLVTRESGSRGARADPPRARLGAGCGVQGVGGPMPPGSRPPPARCAPACLPSREKGLSRCVNTLSKGPYFLSLRQPNSSYELAGWPEGPSGR